MGFIDNLTQLQIANLQGEALHTNRSEYPSPGSRSWFGSPGSRHSLPSHLGRPQKFTGRWSCSIAKLSMQRFNRGLWVRCNDL